MFLQRALCEELFLTNVAREWFFAVVATFVNRDSIFRDE